MSGKQSQEIATGSAWDVGSAREKEPSKPIDRGDVEKFRDHCERVGGAETRDHIIQCHHERIMRRERISI